MVRGWFIYLIMLGFYGYNHWLHLATWPQIYYYTFVYLQHLSFLEFTLNFIFLFDPHTYGHVMIICQCSHMARREKISFNIFLWWMMNQTIAFAIKWDLTVNCQKNCNLFSPTSNGVRTIICNIGCRWHDISLKRQNHLHNWKF